MNSHTEDIRSDLDFHRLKAKQREIRGGFPEALGLRTHRALSWIGRAERETADLDAAFLFYWIAFNAAYAADSDSPNERAAFQGFFDKLMRLDHDNRIYNAVWQRFTGPIRLFLENRYVFSPFWSHHNGVEGYEDWQERFSSARRTFNTALSRQDTTRVLSMLFDRLYVLRNQLMHGGATWGSRVNRDQLRDGVAILAVLVPVMVDIMMDHSNEDWGKPFYPVVDAP